MFFFCFCFYYIFYFFIFLGGGGGSKSAFSKTVWAQIRPDVFVGPYLGQTVCKSYQQMTLVGKEIIPDGYAILGL